MNIIKDTLGCHYDVLKENIMGKLEVIYPIAIEHTKQKVIQDIDHYLAMQELLPL